MSCYKPPLLMVRFRLAPRSHSTPSGSLSLPTLLLVIVFCSYLNVAGQSATATLSGTVEDQNGAVIPGVNITVRGSDTGLQRETTTNGEGHFIVPLLPPGKYLVRARRDGFAPVDFPDVLLNVGDQKALAIQLKAGDVSEMVQVTGEVPLINESPAVSTAVDRQFVENIPLNGRSFQSLITLVPGVVLTKTSFGEQGQFSINGQRADANYFTVDGVSANTGVSAGVVLNQSGGSLPAFSAAGGTNSLVSVDALQEFKIQTSSYAPEFGRTAGGQIALVTRSGTNQFHGTLFEYFRNDALDANDWFANRNRQPKPPLRQNDFGGVFGGPIIRHRTFFFFSYEGLRLRQPRVATSAVPTVASRQDGATAIRPFLNAFPVPNGPATGNDFAIFSASFSNPASLNATSIRIDHSFTSKLNIFGRYNHAPSEASQRGSSTTSLNTVGHTSFKSRTLTLGTTWLIRSTLINDLRVNYTANEGGSVSIIDDFGGATVPADSVFFPSPFARENALFLFNLGGPVAYILGKNVDNRQRQFNLVDTLSWVQGSHQLKFGVDYRRISPTYGPRDYEQIASFSGVAGAQSGAADFVFISSRDEVGILFNNLSAFAQDTWKLNRRVTLNYGLRWEIEPPPSGRDGKELFTVQGLNNLLAMTLAPAGTPLFETTYNNFAPRVGVAIQLRETSASQTVLRGGFGIFYDLNSGSLSNAASSFPYIRQKLVFPIPTPFPITDPAASAPVPFNLNPPFNVVTSIPDLKLPRTYQWNVSLDQGLGVNQLLTVSYVGAAGRRLLRQEILQNFGNPNFSSLLLTGNGATSNYRALQVQLQRRLSRSFQALASYTWSRSLDNASNNSISTNTPVQQIDPQIDRGASDFDIRHSFSAALTYNLPKPDAGVAGRALLRDWSVDAIVNARSASPVNVTVVRNLGAGIGFIPTRPDLVTGVPIFLNDPNAPGGKRINNTPAPTGPGQPIQIGPFLIPTATRQGTLERNSLRGFPLTQLDLALRRRFNLTERVNLQFGAEFFNLFNHPNFADPDSNLGTAIGTFLIPNGFFGQSRSMLSGSLGSGGIFGGLNPLYQVGGPRSIQFSLKLKF